jgi:hypothetical protein
MTFSLIQRSLRTALALTLLLGLPAHARGPSPYLPLNLAPEIERDLERVLILADMPAMRRPFAAAILLDALPRACAYDEQLCARVRRYLSRYMEPLTMTDLGGEVAWNDDDGETPLPNRHGLNAEDSWQLSGHALWQPSDSFIVSLGAVADPSDVVPTGTMVSFGWDWAQMDIGWRDHWLSPFTDSSMLVSTQGKTMPSITLSNYRPLTRFGFTYELFLARMAYSDRIVSGPEFTSGHPRLAGFSAAIEPIRGWSIGVNRVMQFGGGNRGGNSLGDIFDAFFNPSKHDNVKDLVNQTQFGNQAAAFTSRFLFPGRVPFATYFEYAGEDTSRNKNWRLGNSALSIGVDFPYLGKHFDATYEFSEWQNAWYVHGVYLDGLANDGYVLGHWFGNQRVSGDAVGGQSHMMRIGWRPGFGGQLDLRYRTIRNERYGFDDYTRGHDVTLTYAFPVQRFTVGAQIQAGRTVLDDEYARVAGFVRFTEWNLRSTAVATVNDRSSDAELFVDAGVSANRVKTDLTDGSPDPTSTSDTKYAPHVGIGVRRLGRRHDFGARLELDEADEELLLAVRAIDYRFRWSERFAFSGFLGAARYNAAIPAFGYYLGAGVQWRDVFPRIDLSLDLRYAERVARDKIALSDPPRVGGRPDIFYDIGLASLYLSYRW